MFKNIVYSVRFLGMHVQNLKEIKKKIEKLGFQKIEKIGDFS